MCYYEDNTDASHFPRRRCAVRFYHFTMKFLRSFAVGFGIGSAAALILLSLVLAVLLIRGGF